MLNIFCVFVGLLMMFPLVVLVAASFSPESIPTFPPTGFTLGWYSEIPGDFIGASLTSLVVATATTCISVVLGVSAALATTRSRRIAILDVLFRTPLLLPALVLGVSLFLFYILLRDVLQFDLRDSPHGLVVAYVVIAAPYPYIVAVARLANFDRQIEEAAFGLGAGQFTTLRLITLPLIRPAIFTGALLAFIVSAHDVTIAIFLAGNSTTTLPLELFRATQLQFVPWVLAVAALQLAFYTILALVLQRVVGLRTSATASVES